jgi:hypothetical protein
MMEFSGTDHPGCRFLLLLLLMDPVPWSKAMKKGGYLFFRSGTAKAEWSATFAVNAGRLKPAFRSSKSGALIWKRRI